MGEMARQDFLLNLLFRKVTKTHKKKMKSPRGPVRVGRGRARDTDKDKKVLPCEFPGGARV